MLHLGNNITFGTRKLYRSKEDVNNFNFLSANLIYKSTDFIVVILVFENERAAQDDTLSNFELEKSKKQ